MLGPVVRAPSLSHSLPLPCPALPHMVSLIAARHASPTSMQFTILFLPRVYSPITTNHIRTEWQDERPPSPSYLRILYLGKILQDDDTLASKLHLPYPMPLLVLPIIPKELTNSLRPSSHSSVPSLPPPATLKLHCAAPRIST